jgi:hypothetical protein
MSPSLPPASPAEVEQALATHEAVGRAMEQRPGWRDYVSEGVIDHIPDPGEDGVPEAVAPTPEATMRAYEMNLAAEMIEAEHVEQRMGSLPRVTLKGPDGKPRSVTEKNADKADRKFHAIRTGHLTAACVYCKREVILPERILRYGLRKPRCKQCRRPLKTYVSLRKG